MLIISIINLSWLGMMIVHEAGHVLLAWACGETVSRVVLHPLAISRTDVSHDKQPLLVAFGGPLVGVAVPLAAFGVAAYLRSSASYLFRFFAGFCLLANGLYVGAGSISRVGDAGDLLRFGCPGWVLVAFGLATAPLGLVLWNGIGPRFGLGSGRGIVDRRHALVTFAILTIVVATELLLA
jgi:hypothetical protein